MPDNEFPVRIENAHVVVDETGREDRFEHAERVVNAKRIRRLVTPRTVAVELLFPFHQIALAAIFLDEFMDVIAALAGALGAFDVEHVELARDIAKDEIGPRH
jgi:hypothetical protein